MPKEYFHGLTTEDARQERCVLRNRIIFWACVIGIVLGGSLIYAAKVWAVPLYEGVANGVKVTLHDEDCKLAEVINLKKRATWQEGNKIFEGCWGLHQGTDVVVAYFSDKTVAIFPPQMFRPVRGA